MSSSEASTRGRKSRAAKPEAASEASEVEPTRAPETIEALGPEAIARLAQIMREGSTDTARIAACNALLDRAYGKARAGGASGGTAAEAAEPPMETRVTVRFV
jgi:hypothetical protein